MGFPWQNMLLIVCLASVYQNQVRAESIYEYTGDDGVVHLSNVPANSKYRLLIPGADALSGAAPSRLRYDRIIVETADAYGLDSALLHAVITVESKYNPSAVSRKGAVGLMQLMPATARQYGVADLYDPEQNIQGGAKYLRDLLAQFNGDLKLSLAAYNAGENAVARYGNHIPPYRETRNYVSRVMDFYQKYGAVRAY